MTLPTVSKPRHDPVTTIAPIAEIIAEARNGKPFILVDADDRENEGDIIIPAQFATPDRINQMATHARGLICLTITAERARFLELEQMSQNNRSSRSEEHTSELQSLMRISYAVFCLNKKNTQAQHTQHECTTTHKIQTKNITKQT